MLPAKQVTVRHIRQEGFLFEETGCVAYSEITHAIIPVTNLTELVRMQSALLLQGGALEVPGSRLTAWTPCRHVDYVRTSNRIRLTECVFCFGTRHEHFDGPE